IMSSRFTLWANAFVGRLSFHLSLMTYSACPFVRADETDKIATTIRIMEYTEQQKFLRSGRVWGMGLVVVLFAAVEACILIGKISGLVPLALYAALAYALAIFIYYTPDYL